MFDRVVESVDDRLEHRHLRLHHRLLRDDADAKAGLHPHTAVTRSGTSRDTLASTSWVARYQVQIQRGCRCKNSGATSGLHPDMEIRRDPRNDPKNPVQGPAWVVQRVDADPVAVLQSPLHCDRYQCWSNSTFVHVLLSCGISRNQHEYCTYKGRDLRHALCVASTPRKDNPQSRGPNWSPSCPHQAHRFAARTTANSRATTVRQPWV